jgi:hypothetical protein
MLSNLDYETPRVQPYDEARGEEYCQHNINILEDIRSIVTVRSARYQQDLWCYHTRHMRERSSIVVRPSTPKGNTVQEDAQDVLNVRDLESDPLEDFQDQQPQGERAHQHLEHQTTVISIPSLFFLSTFLISRLSNKTHRPTNK